jgi:hypothetical protein
LHDPNTKYVAICNRWLAEDEDDGEIVRDLILKKEGTETKKSKEKELQLIRFRDFMLLFTDNQYKITVFTGNVRGAGTDANVFINIYGNLGETGAVILDDRQNNFESGK